MTKKINSKFFIVAVLVLLLVLISAFIFVSTNTAEVVYAAQLATPAVAWDENGGVLYAKWNTVENAYGYNFRLVNKTTNTTVFSSIYTTENGIYNATSEAFLFPTTNYFVPGDTYYFVVYAYADGFQNSEEAQSVDHENLGTKGAMATVQIADTTVSWSYVSDALGYDVWISKKDSSSIYVQQGNVLNTLENNIDVDAQLRQYGAGDYKVEVQAYKTVSGNYLTQKGEATKDDWYAPLHFADDPSFDIPISYVDVKIKDIDLRGAVSGGKPPYTFSNLANLLPSGVTVSSAGIISGTPTTPQAENDAEITVDDQSTGGSKFIIIHFGEVKNLLETEIAYISIGVQNALKGNYISGDIETLDLPENAKYSIVEAGLKWWNYTTSSDCTGETFDETGDYEVSIKVTPSAGNSFVPEVSITGEINGNFATVEKETDTIYVLKYRFGAAADPAQYTITYNQGTGGSGSMPAGTPTTAYEERPYTLPANSFIAPIGQEFDYWKISTDSTNKYYPNDEFVFTTDATITAVWKDINYTITYVAGSASGGTNALPGMATTKKYNAEYTVSNNHPLTRDGYRQTGWSRTGEKDDNTGKETEPIVVTDNIILYPVWIQTFKVTYAVGSATGGKDGYPQILTFDKGAKHTVSNNHPLTKTGYRQTGWSTTGEQNDNTGQVTGDVDVTSNITFNPVWIQTFKVTYAVGSATGGKEGYPKNVTVDKGATYHFITPFPFTRDSHTHTGWTEGAENEDDTGKVGASTVVEGDITLNPVWKIKTYDVIYNFGSGSGTLPANGLKTYNQKYSPIATYSLGDAIPLTRTGYRQVGWWKGTAESETLADAITEIAENVNETINLYPVWVKTYALTFVDSTNDNGNYAKGDVINIVAKTISKKRFTHWSDNPSTSGAAFGNTAVASTTFTMPENVVTVTANYVDLYTVTVIEGTGSGDYAENDTVTIEANGEVVNARRFKEWNVTLGGVTPSPVTGERLKATFKMINGPVNIEAVYDTLYKITVDNGVSTTTSYAASGDPITIEAADREANNKRFTEWTVSPDSVVLSTDGLNPLKATFTMIGNAVTATANYVDTYDVIYKKGLGDWGDSGPLAKGIKVHDVKFTDIDTTRPLTREGYDQVGWWIGAQDSENPFDAITEINVNQHVALYPVWQIKIYVITYNKGLGSNTWAESVGDVGLPAGNKTHGVNFSVSTYAIGEDIPVLREGYRQVGWSNIAESTNPQDVIENLTKNEAATLYPVWVQRFNVTYKVGSATGGKDGYPKTFTLDKGATFGISTSFPFTRDSHNHMGWGYEENANGTDTVSGDITVDKNIDLFPVWEIKKFKVTISITNAAYGSVDVTKVEDVPYGAPLAQSGNSLLVNGIPKVVATPNPSDDADDYVYILYTFYIEGEEVVKSDKNVIAWFGVKPKITYARGEYGVGTLPAWGRKEFNKPYNVSTSYPLTRTGYKQVGWGYEESTDTTKKVDKIHDLIDEIKTLYPIWQIQKFTINFNSNEGSDVDAITQDYDTAVSKPNDPTRPGYGFSGWYTTADLNVEYSFTTMPGENITVYAGWTANNNTIVFNGSGCPGVAMANQTIATDAKENLNANTYVWPGRTFEGWTKTENSTDLDFLNGAEYTMGTEASYTLWAVWSINKYTVTFLNEDGTVVVLTKDDYIYDDVIVGPEGDDPTKEADNTYTYEFIGWGTWTAGTRVKENVTYRATFKSTYIEYKVKWLNHDGSTIKTDSLHYGDMPRFKGGSPTKASDNTYDYIWNNSWDKDLVAVTEDVEYTATFSEEYRKYTIIFYAEDGETEILKKADYHYGDVVTKPANPTKAADAANTYEFAGWDKAVVNVAGDTSYTATFTATKIEYEVTFANATVTGVDTPPTTIKDGDEITVTADAAPEGKKFDGWYVNGEKVSDDINFTYTFDATKGNVALEARYVDVVTEDVSGDNDPIAEIEADNKKGGLGGGAIAGIVIACLVVAGVGGFAIFWFVIKKKTFADLTNIFKKKAKKEGKAEEEEKEDKK